MEKIEYEKPELKELNTDRGEGFCVDVGSGDAEICMTGNVAGNLCNNGVSGEV